MPVKQRKQTDVSSTQKYLKLAELHDDVIVLKDGGLRAVLETSSINFDLKNPEEQQSVIAGYQKFLNSLNFPIQIVVRSRKMDINSYLESMKVMADKNKDQIMKEQTVEYIEFMRQLVEVADIMQKKFYVVIPFDPPGSEHKTFLDKFMEKVSPSDSLSMYKTRKKQFTKIVKGLHERVGTVSSGLQGVGLEVRQLKTNELVELFYNIYNPVISMQERIEDLDGLSFNMMEDAKQSEDLESAPKK